MGNSWAAPGVRCVCVDDGWEELRCGLPNRIPMLGEVLTIKHVKPGSGGMFGGDVGHVYLTFWEIDEVQQAGGITASIGWISTQFEPLVEQQTDISTLTALLQPTRELADV